MSSIPFMKLAEPPPLSKEAIEAREKMTPAQRAAARFSLEGKTAAVTGGARGLGLEITTALLEHGASTVCILDILLAAPYEPAPSAAAPSASGTTAEPPKPPPIGSPLPPSLRDLQSRFPEATILFFPADVTDEEVVRGAIGECARFARRLDILVCCAGTVQCAHALEHDVARFRKVLDVNLTGSFIAAQAAAREMVQLRTQREQGDTSIQQSLGESSGSIVFLASLSAHSVNFPQPQCAYNASKAAVVALARSLAAEWARHGVRVNSVSPGYMDTVLNEGDGLELARRAWAERTPVGRMGRPEELVGVVVMLCSAAGGYITGSDVRVDGGISVF